MNIFSKNKSGTIKTCLCRACLHGFLGFGLFFSLIFFLKALQMMFGITMRFQIDLFDVLISLTGFAMMFLINFLKNFEQNNDKNLGNGTYSEKLDHF